MLELPRLPCVDCGEVFAWVAFEELVAPVCAGICTSCAAKYGGQTRQMRQRILDQMITTGAPEPSR